MEEILLLATDNFSSEVNRPWGRLGKERGAGKKGRRRRAETYDLGGYSRYFVAA
jgi:hypothetical protein